MEQNNLDDAPAFTPSERIIPKRGPEPIEVEFPTASVAAVEDAKEFAAATVRPEPVEELKTIAEPEVTLDPDLLLKIALSPEIAEALAKDGLMIDQNEINRALEENDRRRALENVLSPSASVTDLNKAFTPDEVRETEGLEPITPESFRDLKMGINSSFEEVASLLLDQQRQIDEIEARLTNHNSRGGHKI